MDVFIFTVFSIKKFCKQIADPDQMLHFAASELGLHYLLTTPKWVSGLKRVN